ncbi:MAG: hypothetical protein HZC42_14335 [Candidatus Eisenbacteria bacterium]|nr:hypothetical protein [Candidatus Eisenbacteria bacterium]
MLWWFLTHIPLVGVAIFVSQCISVGVATKYPQHPEVWWATFARAIAAGGFFAAIGMLMLHR